MSEKFLIVWFSQKNVRFCCLIYSIIFLMLINERVEVNGLIYKLMKNANG